MLDRLADLLVPPRCLSCAAPGADLCAACRHALPFLAGPLCARCGLPVPCGRRCPAASLGLDAAWAPVAHAGAARELVAALKFHRARRASRTMAAQIAALAPDGLLDGALVPVPAHPARRAQRGYDQAVVLARALRTRTGLPVSACLRRRGPARRQLGASRAVRLQAGRIRVEARGRVPAVCVLVDDVHTTGATLGACALALRAAGAQRVVAVTYARALAR